MAQRDKDKDPVEGLIRNHKLEMPLKAGGKDMATPGSIPPKKKRKKKENVDFFDEEVKKNDPNMNKTSTEPIEDAERVKKWAAKKFAGTATKEDDKEEVFTLTKSQLAEILQNPIGLLAAGNEKDAEFIHSYMKVGNVQDALIAVKYAPPAILKNKTSLLALARTMMGRPEIAAAVGWCKSQRIDDLIVSRDEYADYLSQVVRGNIGDMLDDNGLLVPSKIKKYGRCIEAYASSIAKDGKAKISIKMRNPVGAAKELAKFENWEDQCSDGGAGSNLGNDALEAIEDSDEIIDVKVEEDGEKTLAGKV